MRNNISDILFSNNVRKLMSLLPDIAPHADLIRQYDDYSLKHVKNLTFDFSNEYIFASLSSVMSRLEVINLVGAPLYGLILPVSKICKDISLGEERSLRVAFLTCVLVQDLYGSKKIASVLRQPTFVDDEQTLWNLLSTKSFDKVHEELNALRREKEVR